MSGEATDFLYPFLDEGASGVDGLLGDLASSARAKWADSARLTEETLDLSGGALDGAAAAVTAAVAAGGQVLAFGNGGSAADADAFVQLLSRPTRGPAISARSLVADASVLTALANDIGISAVFARQVMAHGRPGDVAVGFSTSGDSANLVAAFTEAHGRGLTTVGFAGYDGGAMAASGDVDHCLVVPSESVHRIQEAQVALAYRLWSLVQRELPAVAPR